MFDCTNLATCLIVQVCNMFDCTYVTTCLIAQTLLLDYITLAVKTLLHFDKIGLETSLIVQHFLYG